MIAETSRAAYKTLHKLGDKQQAVYDVIKEHGPISNEQIAERLGWPINNVTGRTNELCTRFGVVVAHGLTIGKSGKSAKTWVVADLNDSKLKEVAQEEPKRAVPWLSEDRGY